MNYPKIIVEAARRSLREGKQGIDWVFFHSHRNVERDAVRGWIIAMRHPLGDQPCTDQDRFYELVKECAARLTRISEPLEFQDNCTSVIHPLYNQGDEEQRIRSVLEFPSPYAIEIGFDGFTEKCAAPGHGRPVRIEFYEGELRVLVWADANSEDATHTIPLSGAKEEARVKEN